MVEETYPFIATIPRTGRDPVNGCAVPVAQAGHAVPEEPEMCQADAHAPRLDPGDPGEPFTPEITESSNLLSPGDGQVGADAGRDDPRYPY
jgi:hypothetical protein